MALDLEYIKFRASGDFGLWGEMVFEKDVPALIAEVERLRRFTLAIKRSTDTSLGTISLDCGCGVGVLLPDNSFGAAREREFVREHADHCNPVPA